MLACIQQYSTAYHVPVPAIERVLKSASTAKQGIGPMGIPYQWSNVLQTYGFNMTVVKTNKCWGIAAGTWIMAVENMYRRDAYGTVSGGSFGYPYALPSIPSFAVHDAKLAQSVTGVPADMILAVAAQESGFNPNAVSPAGADGIMQFIPATWSHYGRGSPFNPKNAMMAGALYLRHLALEFHSWPLALAGYNAGGQAVRNAGLRIPPFRQTENYVPDVLYHYKQIAAVQ